MTSGARARPGIAAPCGALRPGARVLRRRPAAAFHTLRDGPLRRQFHAELPHDTE